MEQCIFQNIFMICSIVIIFCKLIKHTYSSIKEPLPYLNYVFVLFYQRNDENVAGLHKNPRADAKDNRQQDRQDQIRLNQRKSFIDDIPKPKDKDQDILRFQPPPPSKPPPSIAPAALQARFLQSIRTGAGPKICSGTGATLLAVDSSEDQVYPYPNQLQRSATLPAKHNRLGVRSRVTFKVPSTITQTPSPSALPAVAAAVPTAAVPTAAVALERISNIAAPNNQVAQKETAKMTSEDLLQPGHVVKERWKVFQLHLHFNFLR